MKKHNVIALLYLVCGAGCGSHPLDTLGSALDSAMEEANDWVERPQLEQRRYQCTKESGVWSEKVTVGACEEGSALVEVDGEAQAQECRSGQGYDYENQCVHRDDAGQFYFNDGPSHPAWMQSLGGAVHESVDLGRWNTLFWAAGVNHDYCYHHNGATRQYTQEICDQQFFSDLSAICAQPKFEELEWFGVETCRNHAASMLAAVRAVGEEPWSVMDTRVSYPEWRPMWQILGMPEDVSDPELSAQIDAIIERVQNPLKVF